MKAGKIINLPTFNNNFKNTQKNRLADKIRQD
jgi:hypothetical protein